MKLEYTSKDHSAFVSCWAFFCRFTSRFLAGPSSSRKGNRPAFFVFGRCLMRRIIKSPRGHPMLQPDSLSTLHLLSSGKQYFRRDSICLYQGDILSQQLSPSLIKNASLCPDFWSEESINTYYADMGISIPVPAFSFSRNTFQPQISA